MPVDFPDLESLRRRYDKADRVPYKEGEPEAVYRERCAVYMETVWEDRVEAHEIRTKKGWDQWDRDEEWQFMGISKASGANWPEDLRKAFKEKVAAFWEADENKNEYENPCDLRACRIGNLLEELAFRKIEERGCCGSFEIEWELCGVKVKYGFNYGH